eukprot:CAMPEP_0172493448 /NCGR_PEP_ID=MMETSP1066-20121228/24907_1 /TAXON_ID=671091 /ORGANISM="Coscinodiscus wailesii, Strain CCMP2513" /LENGTH=188 /DNA_ID=CAMNT_0013263639 /DNA_START=394 /DNA_END=960 /DNA_ORIENTATION=-
MTTGTATIHDTNPDNNTDSDHTEKNVERYVMRKAYQINCDKTTVLIDALIAPDNSSYTDNIPRCISDTNDGRLCTTLPSDMMGIVPTRTPVEYEGDIMKNDDTTKYDAASDYKIDNDYTENIVECDKMTRAHRSVDDTAIISIGDGVETYFCDEPPTRTPAHKEDITRNDDTMRQDATPDYDAGNDDT